MAYQTTTLTNNPAGMPYAPIVNNPNMNWNGQTGQWGGAPSGQPYSGSGGIFGAYGGAGGGMPNSPQGLFDLQNQSVQDTRNYNRSLWGDVGGYTRGVPQGFDADPMNQGARGLASRLLADPEAINDRTQQLMVNRASALANSAANANRQGAVSRLSQRGMLGGSQQNAVLGGIERNRMGQLGQIGAQAEMDRAIRRNQDYASAIGIGSQLAGQQAGIFGDAAKTLMSGVPYEAPTDYSGLGAMMGLGGAMGGAFGLGNLGGHYASGRTGGGPVGASLFGMNQQGPSVNPYGAYQNNFNPNWNSGFGAGSLYSTGAPGGIFGNPYGGGGNAFTGGQMDVGNGNPYAQGPGQWNTGYGSTGGPSMGQPGFNNEYQPSLFSQFDPRLG